MSEEKKREERFINSLCLSVQVSENLTKHIQIVISADDENKLHCYFDVIDPDKLPKFAE